MNKSYRYLIIDVLFQIKALGRAEGRRAMAGMWALDTMALPSVKDNAEDASRSSKNLTGVDQHAAESYPMAPKATNPVDTRHDFTEEALVKLEAAANSLPFAHFCDKCEKAAQAKSAQRKRSIFFDKELIYRLQRASPGPVSLFPILRFLLPETDPRQGQFKLRHRTMGDVIVKTLGLAAKSEAALRIMNFSMPEQYVGAGLEKGHGGMHLVGGGG